jgi:preprotein translocase subunit SecE
VARNRKRRSDRRSRRPSDAAISQPGVATARGGRREETPDPIEGRRGETPDPIEHATPDVELAEAQLAVGRPELTGEELPADEPLGDEPFAGEPLEEEPLEDDGRRGGRGGGSGRGTGGSGPRRGGGGDLVPGSAPVPATRAGLGTRLVQFVQGSWRELQRVQWPDRRQVMQATGVVIGFVIVAGIVLGVADWVAGKAGNVILK